MRPFRCMVRTVRGAGSGGSLLAAALVLSLLLDGLLA